MRITKFADRRRTDGNLKSLFYGLNLVANRNADGLKQERNYKSFIKT
jgi:hypothetical protein